MATIYPHKHAVCQYRGNKHSFVNSGHSGCEIVKILILIMEINFIAACCNIKTFSPIREITLKEARN